MYFPNKPDISTSSLQFVDNNPLYISPSIHADGNPGVYSDRSNQSGMEIPLDTQEEVLEGFDSRNFSGLDNGRAILGG